jgi:hypothetical protein
MQYNTLQPRRQEQQHAQPAAGSTDLSSLLGVRIGQDVSGNFALTPAGLAVLGRDGRYFALDSLAEGPQLMDVTSLVVPGDAGVYRLPVPEVHTGDLIVISDSPFQSMFVLGMEGGRAVLGLDPSCNLLVTYLPPDNQFTRLLFGDTANMFVRIVSIFDVLAGMIGDF